MFIVWGKKRVEKNLGFVAEFCPICRVAESFAIRSLTMKDHVYCMTYGAGDLIGHFARCQACGSDKEVDAGRFITIAHTPAGGAEALRITTFPNLNDVYAERLAIEKDVREGKSLAHREVLLMEPFQMMAVPVQLLFTEELTLTKESGVGGLICLLLGVGLWVAGRLIWPSDEIPSWAILTTLGLIALTILLTIIHMMFAPDRKLRSEIIPNLVRALRPLRPTLAELSGCLQRLQMAGYKIGAKVKPDDLYARVWS